MPSNFDIAIEKTLAHEGGYVNDPEDPGGQTKFGISRHAYPRIHISTLSINGRFIWSSNDHPEIRKVFKRFKIKPMKLKYMVSKGKQTTGMELWVMD